MSGMIVVVMHSTRAALSKAASGAIVSTVRGMSVSVLASLQIVAVAVAGVVVFVFVVETTNDMIDSVVMPIPLAQATAIVTAIVNAIVSSTLTVVMTDFLSFYPCKGHGKVGLA